MQHLEEVTDVTRVSEDNERIRAHMVVLTSCQGLFFYNDDKNTYYEIIHIQGCLSKFMIS